MAALGRRTQFERGNLVGLDSGLRAASLPADQAALADYLDAYVGESIADVGGVSEVGIRERSQHTNRALNQRSINILAAAIETKGIFDKHGKLRVVWLQRLEGLVNTAKQLDALLGLARRQKPVNPLDAVRHAVAEANRGATSDADRTEEDA
jgi:hypothetical protein